MMLLSTKNPEYILDIVKGSFRKEIRYLSFYEKNSDLIRITGYLVKRSEIEKLKSGQNVLHDTTALGMGAVINGKFWIERCTDYAGYG